MGRAMQAVLLDATSLYGTVVGTNSYRAWRELLAANKRGEVALIVGSLTLLEVRGLLGREVRSRLDRARTADSGLAAVGVEHQRPTLSVDGIVSNRMAELEHTLQVHDVQISPPPRAAHETLVQRAAERRPPFDSDGNGYRDTLLWYSVLELIEDGYTVTLVSADSAFVAKGTDALHPRLIAEAGGAHNVVRARCLAEASDRVRSRAVLQDRLDRDGDLRWDAFKAIQATLCGSPCETPNQALRGWPVLTGGVWVTSIELPSSLQVVDLQSVHTSTRLTLSAMLSARIDLRLADFDDEAIDSLIWADVEDIGRGLTDCWLQIYASGLIEVRAVIGLDPGGAVVGPADILRISPARESEAAATAA